MDNQSRLKPREDRGSCPTWHLPYWGNCHTGAVVYLGSCLPGQLSLLGNCLSWQLFILAVVQPGQLLPEQLLSEKMSVRYS